MLTPGSLVGSYRVEAVLGRGGMGVVYRAEHVHLSRPAALKVLTDELAADATFRERFVRESRLAASLDHPNIIPVYDAGEAAGLLYLAMRLIQGRDLATLLEAAGRLDASRAVELLEPVASALDEAHAHGLVHRDVKPSNVMVAGADGRHGEQVYLTDFGVVRQIGGSTAALTTAFVGTLAYAAPEQLLGQPVDARTDVYSLGCVLFQCLAGALPYQRDSQVSMMVAHLEEPPPDLAASRLDLPAGLGEVIRRAMAKSPGDRPGSCGELLAQARHALATTIPGPARAPAAPDTVLEPPATTWTGKPPALPRRRSRWLVPLAVVGVAALAAAGTAAALLL
ncbi:MAG: serine/threonine-protein kinase, partial [Mycobacteriales bacterium]